MLKEWDQFLHAQKVVEDGNAETRYRLYHLSFLEFVEHKQEIKDERVDLKAMHAQIAKSLTNALYGD